MYTFVIGCTGHAANYKSVNFTLYMFLPALPFNGTSHLLLWRMAENRTKKRRFRLNTSSQEDLEIAQKLFQGTHTRLSRAVKDKDFKQISLLQALLETAVGKMTSARKQLDKWQLEREGLDKKRMKMLDDSKPK